MRAIADMARSYRFTPACSQLPAFTFRPAMCFR